jgi:hypothetical protein
LAASALTKEMNVDGTSSVINEGQAPSSPNPPA